MSSQVGGNVVARSSRPDDDDFFPSVLLRSRVLEGVDNLSLELFLREVADQLCILARRKLRETTCLGVLGILHDPPPNPVARTT